MELNYKTTIKPINRKIEAVFYYQGEEPEINREEVIGMVVYEYSDEVDQYAQGFREHIPRGYLVTVGVSDNYFDDPTDYDTFMFFEFDGVKRPDEWYEAHKKKVLTKLEESMKEFDKKIAESKKENSSPVKQG